MLDGRQIGSAGMDVRTGTPVARRIFNSDQSIVVGRAAGAQEVALTRTSLTFFFGSRCGALFCARTAAEARRSEMFYIHDCMKTILAKEKMLTMDTRQSRLNNTVTDLEGIYCFLENTPSMSDYGHGGCIGLSQL